MYLIPVWYTNFGQKGNLNTHVATVYEGKKQFKCDICDSKFGVKGKLNVHVTTVLEGKKQFKCDICNVEFTTKHNMIGHIHTGQRMILIQQN